MNLPPPEKRNYRQKGKSISGKIVKGFVQEATSKISTGTIPSKFETIIYKTNTQKSFGSSATRFFEHDNERPGPGQYKGDCSIKTIDNSKVDSKKGYGNGFASQLIRNPFGNAHLNSGPGPGSYTQLEVQKLLESRTQNFKGSSTFLTYGRDSRKLVQYLDNDNKDNKDNLNKVSPGPGDYNNEPPELLPEYLKTQPNFVFKEGLKDRFGDFYDPSREKQLLPCPQKYHKEDIVGMNKLQNEKALVCGSAFMSESERKPYGDFKKRLGPNSVIPYLSANKKSYHLNLSRKFV